jgi:hypothetical protein
MLQTIDAELAPLTTQLAAVQNISPPDFLSYATWLANQAAVKQRWDGERHMALAAHTFVTLCCIASCQGACTCITQSTTCHAVAFACCRSDPHSDKYSTFPWEVCKNATLVPRALDDSLLPPDTLPRGVVCTWLNACLPLHPCSYGG